MSLASGNWPKFHRDNLNSGGTPAKSIKVPALRWQGVMSAMAVAQSPVVASDGAVFLGDEAGYLYCWDAVGKQRWKLDLDERALTTCALLSDGTLVVASQDGYLYKVNQSSGALVWGSYIHPARESSPAVDPSGNIYIGCRTGYLYSVDSDGNLRWRKDCGINTNPTSPAVVGSTVYTCAGSNLYALDAATGAERWRYAAGGACNTAPAVGPDGTIYFGADDKYLYAVSSDGRLLWRYYCGDIFFSSPAVCNGRVYAVPYNGVLHVLTVDGSFVARVSLGGAVQSSPAVTSDGVVYVGSINCFLYAVNPNGTIRWGMEISNSIMLSSPAVDDFGDVYVANYSGNIYAVMEASPAEAECECTNKLISALTNHPVSFVG